MDAPYRPIACAIYDRYERAILSRTPLTVRWLESERPCEDTVRIQALETAHGTEFVSFEDSRGAHHRVRLDRVTLVA